MSEPVLILGVDPGATSGLCAITTETDDPPVVCQCDTASTTFLARSIIDGYGLSRVLVSCEAFIVSARAGRASNAWAGRDTRELVGAMRVLAKSVGAGFVSHPAGTVKPWASNKRLDAHSWVFAATVGLNHARDAARHALYAGVELGFLSDPLAAVRD